MAMIHLEPQTAQMFSRALGALKPPPNLTLSQWADNYRRLSAEASAAQGRWNTDNAPFQREIMDAIGDVHIRKVVAMMCAQSGKTDGLILNTIGYYMSYYPAPIMIVQPTVNLGESFSKDRLATMIRDTPVLRGLVDNKSRYSGNTIMKKNFAGGQLTIVGANAPTDLRGRPIKVLLADEVDAYKASAGKEGDPVMLAEQRQTTYINSGGGDVFAAQAIGNMLERNAATVTAHIDGLCASAATIVACHADKVVAAADGSYMVHPVSMGVCDYLTAEDMKNCLKALETIRSSIIALYAKKSGKTEDECAKWMDETNWWTATEAKEKGFVDEVDDDAEDSVVENRNGVLFVNSISMNTPFNEAPNFVRSRVTEKPVNRPENMNPAEKPERNDHGGVKDMDIKTTDDLRKAYPDLVANIENEATTAERTRIQEIENATLPGAEDQANEAKFTKPVDSASFAKAVIASMKAKQQEQSKKYLKNAKEAAENSNANSIDNTPPANPEAEDEESKAFMNAIRKANGVK